VKENHMKKILFFLPVVIILTGFYTGKLIDDRVKTLLKTIKLTENDVQQTIFSDFTSPSFYFPGVRELKSIALNDRASQVEVIGKYVKDFTKSDDFIKRYNDYRESRKPSPPEKPKTVEEMKKENKENLTKSIEEMKKASASSPEDQKAMFDETIKALEEQLKSIDDPDNPMYNSQMDSYIQQGYQQQLEQHKNDIAEWEAKYPVNNPNGIIKNCLNEFLNKTKDIDFNAQTAIDQYKKNVFVKQEYERKDYLWKLGFRAGKETTESARKFAQTWLNELK
jgi:Asp-tRNA(Asn)/Glu-tRNA(Gln) amidotransferase A subunit family amidase